MVREQIHRAVSADGTALAGQVYGQGPPLVLVHGAATDENEWNAAGELLAEHYTCYAMNTRGRGRSAWHDDMSPQRLVEDVTAFADSVGAPVRLAGISGGGAYALAAAAQSPAVTAVAVWEPVVFEVISEQLVGEFQSVLERMVKLQADGAPAEAVRTFLSFVGNDHELAELAAADEFAAGARYLAADLREIEQAMTASGPGPTDPSVLAKVTAPVLLLHGAASRLADWFRDGVEFAAAHLPEAQIRVVPGVGHLSCQVEPQPIVRELADFFGRHG